METLQRLYNSEINFTIEAEWDAGYDFKLGDSYNGYKAEANFRDFDEGVAWLSEQAIKYYPDSLFAEQSVAPPNSLREEES